MKKSVIIKISAATVAICVLLILVGLLQRPVSTPIPTFNFLNGRGQAIHLEDLFSVNKSKGDFYSFTDDYNDVCAAADAELTALGYVQIRLIDQKPRSCVYSLRGPRSKDSVGIRIIENQRYVVYSTPKNSQYSSPATYMYHYEEGCVSVEVIQSQYQPWLIFVLKYYIRKLF